VGAGYGADDISGCGARWVTNPGWVVHASFKVRLPDSTGTPWPQQTHANGLEALAPDVFVAHVDVAGHPNRAATVALGHPVLARPGLGNEPGFAMRGQQPWPGVVICCAPVWARSSR